ncbi:hypothetical protein DXG01_014764 [Tephrocybe rancida]|nr:hypothetical protein DXG01_014764 [Tephrocybe rancida]
MKLVSQRKASHHLETRADDVLACAAVRVVAKEGEALRMCRGAEVLALLGPWQVCLSFAYYSSEMLMRGCVAEEELRELEEITQTLRKQAVLLRVCSSEASDNLRKRRTAQACMEELYRRPDAVANGGKADLRSIDFEHGAHSSRYERSPIVEATSGLSSKTAYTIEKLGEMNWRSKDLA